MSEHPKPNVRGETLCNVVDQFPQSDLELRVYATMEEMIIRNRKGRTQQKVPLRPSFSKQYHVEAESSKVEENLDAIERNIQLVAADSNRTYNIIDNASGTIIVTKQIVDTLRKEAMKEILEVRSDVR